MVRDSASRNELEMRERGENRLEITGATHSRAGEDLHIIGSGIPRGYDFSGREGTGDRELAVSLSDSDDIGMKARAHDEFCTCVDGGLGLCSGSDGAGTEEE